MSTVFLSAYSHAVGSTSSRKNTTDVTSVVSGQADDYPSGDVAAMNFSTEASINATSMFLLTVVNHTALRPFVHPDFSLLVQVTTRANDTALTKNLTEATMGVSRSKSSELK